MKIWKYPLGVVGFFQALALVLYCSLVALMLSQGENWFKKVPEYFGPFIFLMVFTTSALISAIIILGYPIILFWHKKQTKEAIKLILYTAGWLLVLVISAITIIVTQN